MAKFFNTSVGKKIIMSLSGLFLVIFLLVHLAANLTAIFDSSGETFLKVADFMEENPLINIMQYVLAAGFILHIFYGSWLTYQNRKTRPIAYAVSSKTEVSWSSQNMWITGALIFVFLILHLYNYFYKLQFTDLVESGQMSKYELLKSVFQAENWPYSVLYIFWFIILALHLNHSLQSGFQTIGLNNQKWLKRLKWLSSIYAMIVAIGFSSITIYFFIQSLNN